MPVGNDIVDLLSPYVIGKSGDKKFLQRVLTTEEQKTVLASTTPDKLLQIFWAAKETAYKAIVKSHPNISSAPRRYPVCLHMPESGSDIQGRVKTPRGIVYITTLQHKDYIHCFGSSLFPVNSKIVYGVKKLTDRTPPDFCRSSNAISRAVRTLAKSKIASILSIPLKNIIITNTGPEEGAPFPEVKINRIKTDISISLSHDGRFIAYALFFHKYQI